MKSCGSAQVKTAAISCSKINRLRVGRLARSRKSRSKSKGTEQVLRRAWTSANQAHAKYSRNQIHESLTFSRSGFTARGGQTRKRAVMGIGPLPLGQDDRTTLALIQI